MYEFDSRVRYSELAEDKKLSLVSVINYFQDCCTFEAEEREVGLEYHDINHTAWMLINWHIKINRRPEFNENIRVKTWAIGFRHFLGERNFTIKNDEGELLVCAYSKWAYVNTLAGVPEKGIPKEEVDAYGAAEPLRADFRKDKIKLPEEMTSVELITVTAGNLDTNHHVNNAEYVGLALSAVSSYLNSVYKNESFSGDVADNSSEKISADRDAEVSLSRVSEIRVEYKLQSVLGDVIYPFVSVKDDNIYVVLRNADGNPKLIAEFTIR
ncbi:MAG: hypothetical protein IKP31_04730 [Lachnospiraceae bacterium]|nr:hypothetical protein [Lachnospiraceae bacterium]